jgi:hypothetical protein
MVPHSAWWEATRRRRKTPPGAAERACPDRKDHDSRSGLSPAASDDSHHAPPSTISATLPQAPTLHVRRGLDVPPPAGRCEGKVLVAVVRVGGTHVAEPMTLRPIRVRAGDFVRQTSQQRRVDSA